MSFETYTPKDGDIVHLRIDAVPERTGRYKIRMMHTGKRAILSNCSSHRKTFVDVCRLVQMYGEGKLTPIDPAELEREKQQVKLRTAAPLRGRRNLAQADVDGLALFDAHRAPQLEI